ncbi:DNA primase [Fischerella thermalis]|uniref:DNA primase n=1 Tax=Fischerella thermalis TaxID=372787 RepID=UPI000C7FC1C8|nr:DNA primase [Fischerella thermalis]MBF1990081.1 DNA primase [Fischerella thermalis M58_A2018_009]MBF2060686.1 DNA primase [Fischerella thermalis M66_A2018_004]MBF2070204.1 DNA primase [Fischerella thermalis M48_A2018_028]PLZ87772.1 DNA primase [Fischerella thermalis CCMEE 5194]
MYTPRLHPDTIEEIKQRTDIYDVISEYVVLRRRGKDFVGLCPFHDEKSPSFTVSPTKQMYYCFGCQAGGNAIKFLMDLHKRSFAEVVLDLAQRYQVPVQTLEPEQRQELQRQLSERSQLYEILASTAQFYQHALRQSQGQIALEYLQQKRRLQDETIVQFNLGYAPAAWETLYRYLVEDKRYPVQLVEKAGLIKPRKESSGYYDVFRDRLMIPIHDVMGRVIGFGGRTLGDEQPKYLNSPETELFNKGKTLFALDKAKAGISQMDQAVVVEGYFDAIALHAAGIKNVVASLGTALSIDQVRILLRYTDSKQLILNFDADKAGNIAAERAIGEIAELAYKGEVQLKILNLPDGKDADEYLHAHTSADYQQLLANAPLWLNWQIQQIVKDRDLKQATDFQQVSQQLVKLLKNISNIDTLNYYVSYCAEILALGDARLVPLRVENLLTQVAPQNNIRAIARSQYKSTPELPTQTNTKTPATSEKSLLEQAEALLLRIYLHCPEHRQTINDALEERDLQFSLSHHRFLWRQILELASESLEDDLISRVQDRCLQFPEEMALVSHLFQLNERSKKEILRTPQVVQATTACMERVLREKRYRHFLELWEQTDPQTEPQRWQSYYQAFYAEKLRLQQLDKQRQFSLTDLL